MTLDSTLLVANGVARDTPTNAPVGETVAGMTRFGYDLYAVSADPNENFVLSPLSIAYAFGMARAGATGATADQLDQVFGFPAKGPHTALNVLSQKLVTIDGPPPTVPATENAEKSKPPLVSIANALFVQNGFPIKEAYLHTLAAQYGTGMRTLDFTSPTAKEQIDAWVREQTADRIKKLFDEIPDKAKLVLANAVYFKGDWKYQFDPERTGPAPFTRADGSVVQVPTMHTSGDYRYAASDRWQAVELPYAGSDLAMWVLLPTVAAGPGELLAPDVLAAVGDGLATTTVDLSLPRWDFGSDINDLLGQLGKLGLTDLSNFGGISDAGLFVADAIHRANITVDEQGTEAAAVTGILMEASARMPIEFRADRPFAFAIVHGPTKTPLFIGHVADPANTHGAAG